jgi:hypothetical protein
VDRPELEKTEQLLAEAGLSTSSQGVDGSAFGSWWVVVNVDPPMRIVWDGKDGWLIVQRQTTELFTDQPVWKDIWVGRDVADRRPERAVAVVVEEMTGG